MTRPLAVIGRVGMYGFVALVYVFLFAPIVLLVMNSVNADPDLHEWGGFTTRWFDRALSDPTVVEGLENSLVIALSATLVAVVVGTLAAIGLQRSGKAVRAATETTTYSRLVMPELVLAVGLLLAFRAVEWPLGAVAVVVGHASLYTAYVIMIVSARLARRNPFIEEAARDLGATGWRALRRVTLPEVAPAVITSGLVVFAFSMDNVITSLFLSSDVTTLPLVLFGLIKTQITPEVNAIATFMLGVTAVLLAGFGLVRLAGGRRRRRRGSPVSEETA